MSLVSLAISVLWLLIGIIVICGIVFLALLAIKTFVPVPTRVEQAVWLIVLILILIAALTMLSGGGGGLRNFRIGALEPAAYTSAAIHHHAGTAIG